MAKQIILIHGSGGTPDNHWFPYIKNAFRNEIVIAPQFPGENNPKLHEWLEVANREVAFTDETVLVGHSLGCPMIMSFLERSTSPVAKVICVAGLYNKQRFADLDFLQDSYKWKTIKDNCRNFTFIHSTNDPWDCDEQEADFVFSVLGGTKIIMADQGHFGSDSFDNPYPEFPLLLKLITE